MRKSESIENLLAALSQFQAQVGTIERTKKVQIPTRTGAKINYSYADLAGIWDIIRKPLTENGLSVSQMLDTDNGATYLETIIGHSSGEFMVAKMLLRCDSSKMTDVGTAITYSRRYALSAALGIVTDDDVDAQPEIEDSKGMMRLSDTQLTEIETLLSGYPDVRAGFLKAYNLSSLSEADGKKFDTYKKQIVKKIEQLTEVKE